MIVFGLRQVWRRLQTLTQLMARVLPLLLLFVTFVFLNAEMWQVANDFSPAAYAVVTVSIAAIAFAFVAVRLPIELDHLARFESWDEVCRIASGTDERTPDRPAGLSTSSRCRSSTSTAATAATRPCCCSSATPCRCC